MDLEAKESVSVMVIDPTGPKILENAVKDLSAQFGLKESSVLTPVLTTGGGVLGKTTTVQTSIFPVPLNACLDCALVDDDLVLDSLVQVLTQPIREWQDQQIASFGGLRVKDIREKIRQEEEDEDAFFAHVKVRDPHAVASFDGKIQAYHQLLHPLSLIENVAPGLLHQAVLRNGGSGLLDLENDLAVRSLLKTRKKARNDFELRTRAFYNKTQEAALLGAQQGTTQVKPAISCLMTCKEPTLAALLCSQDCVVHEFCDLLIICRAQRAENSMASGSAAVPNSLRQLMANLFLQRSSGKARRLTLAPGAEAELLKYYQECRSENQSTRLGRLAPIIAAKVALILHVCSGLEMLNEISQEIMITAIFLARRMVAETGEAANQCIAADQLSGQATKMTRVLQKIRASGQISERELQRSANVKIDELRSMLDDLVLQGEVRYCAEGILEASNIVNPSEERSHESIGGSTADSSAAA